MIEEAIAELPITAVLDDIRRHLQQSDALVLQAPPGAGKTTAVPLALLQAPWLRGRSILVLEPRRVAARAAAERMAALLGQDVGDTVGYRIRMQSRVGPATRIEVVTEGILARRMQGDPGLEGVGLLIFDEVHERSLHSDFGLALAMQGRELFREDDPLKLLLMSATLDGEGLSQLLGGAPIVTSSGRQYPVQYSYLAARPSARELAPLTARAVLRALAERAGNLLVFLPGRREIEAVATLLAAELPEGVMVAPLHGGLGLSQQRRAIEAPPAGCRKVVLATNIAETSLTIEGISSVVDSGRVREAVFDPPTGTTRLVTRQVSRASAEQRAGRAGRLGPGHCYRLWSEEQQGRLVARATPEILQSDLAPLALQLLHWGESDPGELRWQDPPPAALWQQALDLLRALGAATADEGGRWHLSPLGEQLARLPLHPRIGLLLLRGAEFGEIRSAALLAAALEEGGVPRELGSDAAGLLPRFDGGQRQNGSTHAWAQRCREQARRLESLAAKLGAGQGAQAPPTEQLAAVLIALAWPDRVARRRSGRQGQFLLANGRSAALPERDPLASCEWLAVADLGGREDSAVDRIYLAAPLDPALFESQLAPLVTEREVLQWNDREGQLLAESRREIGRLVLSARPLPAVSAEAREGALLALVRERGLALFDWPGEVQQWRARIGLLRELEAGAQDWPDLSDAALLASLEHWLAPWLDGVRRVQDFRRLDMGALLRPLLPWELQRRLDEQAPRKLAVPSGSEVSVDYCNSPPVLAVKLQEMFGCTDTPRIAGGRLALQLQLLSPARRPLALTQDLAAFWQGAYAEVRKEMRGRYPKHPWPDDPLGAAPTRHTKKRGRGPN